MHFISIEHRDLVIPGVGIHKAQHLVAYCIVFQLVNSVEMKAILRAGLVQITEIYVSLPLLIRFFHQNYI